MWNVIVMKMIVELSDYTPKALDVLKIHDEFHANMIDKAIGDLGLEENEVLNEALENILEYFSDEYSDQKRGA